MNAWDIVEKAVKAEQREHRTQIDRLEKQVRQANADADMYANAWQRELASAGIGFRNKRHHIDAMVLTTRELVERLKKAEAALAAHLAVERNRVSA